MSLARDEHLQALRLMAWERAKGELRSIGHASFSAGDKQRWNAMAIFLDMVESFIKIVEDDGLIQ